MGHLRRCGSLAAALTEEGIQVTFLVTTDRAERTLAAGKMRSCRLPGPSYSPGQTLPLDEADEIGRIAERENARAIVVDHYGASPEYLSRLSRSGLFVGVIDDLGDRSVEAAKWILNPAAGADKLSYDVKPDAVLLLGPRFALIRRAFSDARQGLNRTFAPGDSRVLVTLGGGDTASAAAEVIQALDGSPRRLNIRCMLGQEPDDRGKLAAIGARSPHAVEFVIDSEDVPKEMAWADVSVSAAGSTVWELACLGVPMVLLVLSDDQALNASQLEAAGAAVAAGRLGDPGSLARVSSAVPALLGDPDGRRAMSRRSQSLVDGLGAARAAASIRERLAVNA